MSDDLAERIHHMSVRTYRQELALEPGWLKRKKLLTLIARAQIAAQERGWGDTAA